jgi:hypothetical protein
MLLMGLRDFNSWGFLVTGDQRALVNEPYEVAYGGLGTTSTKLPALFYSKEELMVLPPLAKVIVIHECQDCPHKSHTGAFTNGGAKPCCNHPHTVEDRGADCFERTMKRRGGRVPTPGWCPLISVDDVVRMQTKEPQSVHSKAASED